MPKISATTDESGKIRAPPGGSRGDSHIRRPTSYNDTAQEEDWLTRAARLVPCLGIMLALCACLMMGSANLLVKMITSVHGVEVSVTRGVIQLVIYLSLVLIRRLPMRATEGEFKAMTTRCICSALSITCVHYSIKMIPLGDFTVIRFSLPIWALIISYLVLKEPCSLLKILAVIISMTGVVMIAKPNHCLYIFHLLAYGIGLESEKTLEGHVLEYWQAGNLSKLEPNSSALLNSINLAQIEPDENSTHLEGCILGIISSIFLAMSVVSLRLCKRTPSETIIIWVSLYSILFGVSLLSYMGEWRLPNNTRDCIYIVLDGLCGSMGQFCFTNALKVEQSGIVSLARTAEIQVAFLYGTLLLHEQIRATSIVGSILVALAVISIVLPKLFVKQATLTPEQLERKEAAR